MLRIALLTARTRPGTFVGAFLAFAASAVLVVAGGMLLEAALRSQHRSSGTRARPPSSPAISTSATTGTPSSGSARVCPRR
jgi:hypothetical protein